MEPDAAVRQKVHELSQAMKAEGLWKRDEPEWVKNYRSCEAMTTDFFEWLQFVYLPNKLVSPMGTLPAQDSLLMLQAKKFAADKLTSNAIIRLIVELDSLGC